MTMSKNKLTENSDMISESEEFVDQGNVDFEKTIFQSDKKPAEFCPESWRILIDLYMDELKEQICQKLLENQNDDTEKEIC